MFADVDIESRGLVGVWSMERGAPLSYDAASFLPRGVPCATVDAIKNPSGNAC